MPLKKRYSRDEFIRPWTSDSLYNGWLNEGWALDLPWMGGFGLAPIKQEGQPIVYPDVYFDTVKDDERE